MKEKQKPDTILNQSIPYCGSELHKQTWFKNQIIFFLMCKAFS